MKKKYLIILSILLVGISLLSLYSYSYFKVTKTGDTNVIAVNGCLNLTFSDSGDTINIQNATPVSDSFGMRGEVYSFTITNHCDNWSDFQVNLETIPHEGEKYLDVTNFKYDIESENESLIRTTITNSSNVEPSIEGASKANKLYNSKIRPNSTAIFKFRIWMDSSVTDIDTTTSAKYHGKISITGSLSLNGNKTSKVLMAAPIQYNDTTNRYETYSSIWDHKSGIEKIKFVSNDIEITQYDEIFDLSAAQDNSVQGFLQNSLLIIQSENGVNLNENSSYLFADFENLKAIEGKKYIFTENVTDMSYMFSNCKNMTALSLESFDTSNVTNMSHMFENTGYNNARFNINLGNYFDTSKVTNMSYMFYNSGYNSLNFSLIFGNKFDTSSVTTMESMFYGTGNLSTTFELNLSDFDTSNVTNIDEMFAKCGASKIDVSSFDTSNITNMGAYNNGVVSKEGLFSNTNNLTELDLSNWDTSNVTNMSYMFYRFGYKSTQNVILNLNGLDTSKVTDMSYMFSELVSYKSYNNDIFINLNISSFDTSNVTNMSYMFYKFGYGSIQNITLDLSNFDTSKVTDMSYMFYYFAYYNKNFTFNISDFDTSSVTNMSNMFAGCGYNVDQNINLDVSNWDTSKVTNMEKMFYYSSVIVDISGLDFISVNNLDYFGSYSKNISGTIFIDFRYVTNSSNAFSAYNGTKTLNIDYTNDTKSSLSSHLSRYSGNTYAQMGTLLDEPPWDSYNISIPSSITSSSLSSYYRRTVNLYPVDSNNQIKSFKVNGELVEGNTFIMPDEDVEITDVEFYYPHQIIVPTTITSNLSSALYNTQITLNSVESNKAIKSFKVNGTLVNGSSFTMPDEDAIITDIVLEDCYIVESEHNPYANNIDYETYYENTFTGATSITVQLTYQTESTSYDWVYLYTDSSTIYNNRKYGGTTKTTETITIDGNYIKIVFRTDSSDNTYYGFKAIITPNYD